MLFRRFEFATPLSPGEVIDRLGRRTLAEPGIYMAAWFRLNEPGEHAFVGDVAETSFRLIQAAKGHGGQTLHPIAFGDVEARGAGSVVRGVFRPHPAAAIVTLVAVTFLPPIVFLTGGSSDRRGAIAAMVVLGVFVAIAVRSFFTAATAFRRELEVSLK